MGEQTDAQKKELPFAAPFFYGRAGNGVESNYFDVGRNKPGGSRINPFEVHIIRF
ncbi:hypothetical protein [Peribacillus simplex]|uniref:hypothetical protein n=1 Tax=Peribacillus simplex TaxID=1478 RepID=UPI003D26B66D